LAKELEEVHSGHADEGPSTFSMAAAELRRLQDRVIELERLKPECPEGWRLVPVEATYSQLLHGVEGLYQASTRDFEATVLEVDAVWRAMVQAAPDHKP